MDSSYGLLAVCKTNVTFLTTKTEIMIAAIYSVFVRNNLLFLTPDDESARFRHNHLYGLCGPMG